MAPVRGVLRPVLFVRSLGGRSANRGQCAACRLPYEMLVDGGTEAAGRRALPSPGDLSALRHVPEIIAAGVSCMKIEGRYKGVSDYVALTLNSGLSQRRRRRAWAGRTSSITPRQELSRASLLTRPRAAFISGVNHQKVVNGRGPRHRGVQIGNGLAVHDDSVRTRRRMKLLLKPGDGVVFDAADWRSPQEDEGGRVYRGLAALALWISVSLIAIRN